MSKGLTSHQAIQLLSQYGQNIITEQKKKHFIIKLFEQFNNFLTLLLLTAAVLSFIIGEPLDGGLIVAIVILNALFGLYQEAKAEESIAALKKMTVSQVRIIRDGKEQEIDSRFIVPGDIVFIEEGTKISADGIVIQSVNLEINEAALTGESLAVIKGLKDEVFSGTVVSKGRGMMEVQKTGMHTKFGVIAAELAGITDGETPLQKKLSDITRIIGIAGIIIACIVFGLSLFEGSGYFPSFLLAVSLAVAVVPEGLPAVMTITLAIGMKTMAKRKAIIRKLSAIEALGSITLIATDKTGTLTTNKMKVKELYLDEKLYSEEQPPALSNHPFSKILLDGILCSTASLVYIHDHGHYDVLGDPTEGALLLLGQKVGVIPETVRKEWQLIEESPFDSVTKRMSVVVKRQTSKVKQEQFIFTKGAPESILEISDSILLGNTVEKLTEEKKMKIQKTLDEWARKGLRVLAFSYRQLESVPAERGQLNQSKSVNTDSTSLTDLTDSTFLGMVAIHDPPRPEVKGALEKSQRAGIKVVMVTGDNEKTAEAIGVSVGLVQEGDEIVTGKQLDNYTDEQLLTILPKVRIFARTTPFHKARIVKLYQQTGDIVAVTGDGVNDAIALKQADVGVAMGLIGTDVARETADMIVTDDNFATIINAVEEGRNIIKNIKNAVKYLLSCNIAEAVSLIVGMALGLPNLFYPLQLLYINLVTDGLPALSLAFSPRDNRVMEHHPEQDISLLKTHETQYIALVSGIGTLLIIGSYYLFGQAEMGRTAAFTVLTLIQSFIYIDLWLSHSSLHRNFHKLISPLFIFAFLFPVVIQFILLKSPFLATMFRITTVSSVRYLELLLFSALIMIGIKGVKMFLRY